jgi:hypothetical protein
MRIHDTPVSMNEFLLERDVSRALAASLPEGDRRASLRDD